MFLISYKCLNFIRVYFQNISVYRQLNLFNYLFIYYLLTTVLHPHEQNFLSYIHDCMYPWNLIELPVQTKWFVPWARGCGVDRVFGGTRISCLTTCPCKCITLVCLSFTYVMYRQWCGCTVYSYCSIVCNLLQLLLAIFCTHAPIVFFFFSF